MSHIISLYMFYSNPELIVENELERESLDKPPFDLISDVFDILESGLFRISFLLNYACTIVFAKADKCYY